MKSTTLLAAVLTLSAGAGGYAAVVGSNDSAAHSHRPILQVDLDQSGSENLYHAVRELRHGWLPVELADYSKTDPTVYIELRCEQISCLRWIEPGQVERVEYLSQDTADQRSTRSHLGVAIVVSMRTRATGLNADTTGH